ncbi:MAG: FkbM family methyltransferase [Rhodocyclaceae bacterium]|nr:FkbM family methyltransferase [Rhodocyclaceae bacterium]
MTDILASVDGLARARDAADAIRVTLEGALETAVGPSRGALRDQWWQACRMLDLVPCHFSQSGQDHFIDVVLTDGARDRVFVEVGALDGVTGSNTLFFEMFRGWRGLLVEAVPELAEAARQNRRSPCVSAAVGVPGPARLIQVESGYTQMSGLVSAYDDVTLAHVRQHPAHRERTFEVEVRDLADVLDEAGITRVDYLSLDIEGAEVDVLARFPFERIPVAVWSVENPASRPEVPEILGAAGYERVEYVGVDEIYAR